MGILKVPTFPSLAAWKCSINIIIRNQHGDREWGGGDVGEVGGSVCTLDKKILAKIPLLSDWIKQVVGSPECRLLLWGKHVPLPYRALALSGWLVPILWNNVTFSCTNIHLLFYKWNEILWNTTLPAWIQKPSLRWNESSALYLESLFPALPGQNQPPTWSLLFNSRLLPNSNHGTGCLILPHLVFQFLHLSFHVYHSEQTTALTVPGWGSVMHFYFTWNLGFSFPIFFVYCLLNLL